MAWNLWRTEFDLQAGPFSNQPSLAKVVVRVLGGLGLSKGMPNTFSDGVMHSA